MNRRSFLAAFGLAPIAAATSTAAMALVSAATPLAANDVLTLESLSVDVAIRARRDELQTLDAFHTFWNVYPKQSTGSVVLAPSNDLGLLTTVGQVSSTSATLVSGLPAHPELSFEEALA